MESLKEDIDYLEGTSSIQATRVDTREIFFHEQNEFEIDFADVQGQENIKRALEIAAAGGHNLMML